MMNRIPSREELLFADAVAQPPAERGAFLAKACGADVDLLAQLVALIAAHEGQQSLLAGAPAPAQVNASRNKSPRSAPEEFDERAPEVATRNVRQTTDDADPTQPDN